MPANHRVRMTRSLIHEALLELLETKPLEKITVTDICAAADVNRSTFYAHYTDVSQLLLEIENDVLDHLPRIPELPGPKSTAHLPAILESFFEYVCRNKRLFRILIVHLDKDNFGNRLVEAAILAYSDTSAEQLSLSDRYVYTYCVSGVIGMLKEWINDGFTLSPHDFARLVMQMASRSFA